MKELSVQEKAKRYDEISKEVKDFFEDRQKMYSDINQTLEYLFPKLKESEDERISKWIIDDIRYNMNNEPLNNSEYKKKAEKAIAWLEKQGQKTQQTPQWMIDFLNENRGKFASSMGDYDEQREVEGKLLAIIAWLEKQGEHANFRNKIQIGDKVTRNQDGMLVNLSQLNRVAKDEKQGEQKSYASETMNEKGDFDSGFTRMMEKEQKPAWSVSDFRTWQYIVSDVLTKKDGIGQYLDSGECKNIAKYMQEEWSKKLSIEQKPADIRTTGYWNVQDVEIPFGAKDSELMEATYNIPKGFHAEIEGNKVVIKKGEQKPTDNVEPKFKVGDWVVYDHRPYQVVELPKEGCINLVLIGNEKIEFAPSTYCRLWTIQDAKDGDILCCESGWTCIFKTLDSDISFSSYCFMDNTGWFCETGSECHTLDKTFIKAYNGEIYPATKEQCDRLFQKMHEAGYEWNAEKKKLSKLVIDESKAEPKDYSSIDPHFFKTTDKFEPKFHEGEWIISNTVNKDYHICKITGIKDGNYIIESICGYKGYNTFETFEKDYHLWTIKDANDGDVLTCYSDIKGQPIEQTGIIKQYVGRHGGCSNSFKAHFGVDWDNNVVIEGYMGSSNIYPATKEQRDTLFAKIKEAGYEWDAEKKELKKNSKQHLISNYFNAEYKRGKADALKSVAWSEEDEERLQSCLNILQAKGIMGVTETINTKWLKSLKARYTWKPSDEQMKGIECTLKH